MPYRWRRSWSPGGVLTRAPRVLDDRLKHTGRRQRHMRQPHPGCRGDGIGHGRQRRHNRCLAHAAHAIRMARIWHLDDHCINHRHVGCDWHTIIEEARVLQPSVLAIPVLLVERPSDALDGATLHLAFDVARMHCLTCVLHYRIAYYLDCTRVRIDFDVANVRAKAHTGPVGIVLEVPSDRSAGTGELTRNRLERKWLELARVRSRGFCGAILPNYGVYRDAPDRSGACAEHFDGVACRVDHANAGREGHPAAVGHVVVAERSGVGNGRAHAFIRHAELFRDHHAHGGARAPDIRIAIGHGDRAVTVDAERRRRIAAEVEPKAR